MSAIPVTADRPRLSVVRWTIVVLAVALLVLAGVQVAAPRPADAHTSTYCGHDFDGHVNVTWFLWHEGNMTHGRPNHIHIQWHDMLWGTDHSRARTC